MRKILKRKGGTILYQKGMIFRITQATFNFSLHQSSSFFGLPVRSSCVSVWFGQRVLILLRVSSVFPREESVNDFSSFLSSLKMKKIIISVNLLFSDNEERTLIKCF